MKKVLEMITTIPQSQQLSVKQFEVGAMVIIRVLTKKEVEELV